MNEGPPAADVLRGRSPRELSHDVTSFDSAVIFLIKSLFYPVTAVAFGDEAAVAQLAEKPFGFGVRTDQLDPAGVFGDQGDGETVALEYRLQRVALRSGDAASTNAVDSGFPKKRS